MYVRSKGFGWAIASLLLILVPFSLSAPIVLLPATAQTNQDRKAEGDKLLRQCKQYSENNNYEAALSACNQALAVFHQSGDSRNKAKVLTHLGIAHVYLSQIDKSIYYFQQSLLISQHLKDLDGQATALINLGLTYHSLAQYEKAIMYYHQALSISENSKKTYKKAHTLMLLGRTYQYLSQYEKAIICYDQVLSISQQFKYRIVEGTTLVSLSAIYNSLSKYDKSISYAQQALAIYQQMKDHHGEAHAILGLGHIYASQLQYEKAITYYKQALPLFQQVKNRGGEARTLNSMGTASQHLSQYDKAITYYQQALHIYQQVKDREGEGDTLSNIGDLLEQQKQPELAIVFYKQSVNVRETIRADIRNLPRELQESYTQSVAGAYRSLADLLLTQGRLSEAQRVLELLKLQELRDFTRSSDGAEKQDIALLRPEKEILQQYGTVIAFGQKLLTCEQQKQACTALRNQLDQMTVAFEQQATLFQKELRQRLATDPAFLSSDQLSGVATDLVTAQPGTALVYPLVLDNKLRLLIAVQAGQKGVVFRTVEVPDVGQKQLWQEVSDFRELLKTPNSDLTKTQQVAAQLYEWLIRKLEPELTNKEAPITHLVFALDRATRYIPVAALYDQQRKQYLIQQYTVSTILAAELTDTKDRLPRDPAKISVLGLGLSQAIPGFSALESVPAELQAIVRDSQINNGKGIYSGKELLDQAFNFQSFRDNIGDRQIIHIATHGKFEPGRAENSFILSGSGDPLTISEIKKLRNYMKDVHLVVLSACETAVGGPNESGIEVPGISFYFLQNKAKAVMASLWQVNDSSTALLMQQFYKHLADGKTKAEALQLVQQDFISRKLTVKDAKVLDRAGARVYNPGQPPVDSFAHPFYWAPFILIGNSL